MKLIKRPSDSDNRTLLGFATIGLIAIVVAVTLLIGALDLGRTRYQAEFAQAAQLRTGDLVTIAGISVGDVERLDLAGDRVVVHFNIRKDVKLGRDTHAAIKLTTLLGSRYLELSPAGPDRLGSEGIPLTNTAVPYNLQESLADATTTFGRIDADLVAQSLSTLPPSLAGVPEALPQALDNLRSLATVVAHRRDQLKTLLASTDSVTSLIHDQKADLGALVLMGRDLLADINTRRTAVERLFAGATALVDTLNRVLADQPDLDRLLTTLHDFAGMIASHDAQFRSMLEALPIPMRNIANATGSGTAVDANLPAGFLIDSWMCAISGRAQQFNLVEYFKDCQ